MRTVVTAQPGQPVTVTEYEQVHVLGLQPSRRDLAVVAPAADETARGARLSLRWLAGNVLEVIADSYVGVVELDCVTIWIRPKLVGTELEVLQMVNYAAGLGALRHVGGAQQLDAGRNLRDLLCRLLNDEADRLLRHGLRRDYVRRDQSLAMLRGRLRIAQQVQRHPGRVDVLECRFDELSADIPDNQLCAAALAMAARCAIDPVVRAKARVLADEYAGYCTGAGVDARLIAQTLTYNRSNGHYRAAHQWALLLLQVGGFARLFAETGDTVPSFLIDMNKLFELFITRLLRDAMEGTGIRVLAQDPLKGAICRPDGTTYTAIIPDIQLDHDGCRTSIDAKYKLYGEKRVSPNDLYQSFAYAQALDDAGEGSAPRTAYVLYAAAADRPADTVQLRRRNGSIAAQVTSISINVPRILALLGAGNRDTAIAPLQVLVTFLG